MDYFCEGIADELIYALSQIPGIAHHRARLFLSLQEAE